MRTETEPKTAVFLQNLPKPTDGKIVETVTTLQIAKEKVAIAESAAQADTRSVCIIRTTVGHYFNCYWVSHRSLGDIWDFCLKNATESHWQRNNMPSADGHFGPFWWLGDTDAS